MSDPRPGGGSSDHSAPETDVVVVSFNNHLEIRRCVDPLLAIDGVRVFVVDNASADRTLEALRELPVSTFALSENRGFASGCNVGWRAGNAPTVLFLNPDATIDERSIRRLARVLQEDEHVGAVAPKIVGGEGSLEFSQRRFPRLRSTFAQAFFLHRLWPGAPWSDEVVRDVVAYEATGPARSPDWVSGACLMVRRAVLEQIGGFDEDFFLYSEDKDLCKRVRNAAYDVRFEPGAVSVHLGGASADRAALLPVLAESRALYARKHATAGAATLERLGIAVGAITHAAFGRGGLSARWGHLRSLRVVLPLRHAHGARRGGNDPTGPVRSETA